MKLELSIADDRELRNFIKDSIKGEVVSIARGEIKSIIADVVKEGTLPKTAEDLDSLIKKQMVVALKELVYENHMGNLSEFLKREIASIINQQFREMSRFGNVVQER